MIEPVQHNRKRLKIALLTALDAQDRRSWSGTNYSIAQTLQKYCGDVSFIGPMAAYQEMLQGKIQHIGARLFLRKNVAFRYSRVVAQKYARIAQQRLDGQNFDAIIALNGATEIAFLETTTPILLIEDANFAVLHGYHQHFSNLLTSSRQQLHDIQYRSLHKANLLLYSSQWAANAAQQYYGVPQEKIRVIPFGANLEHVPSTQHALQRTISQDCHLLFVGVDWARKGGDIAVATLIELERLGINATLTVCGCTPPKHVTHPRLHVVPFLDKNDEKQRHALAKLYMQADLFLLPTRSECFGIVFCEANAFGLPAITTATGGVTEVVRNGENGFTLPLDAQGDAYARQIKYILDQPSLYTQLVKASRARFNEYLNWDAWGCAAQEALFETLGRKLSSSAKIAGQ